MPETNSRCGAEVLTFQGVSQLPAGPSDLRPLGQRLRDLREEARMTQEDLADAAGIARPQISLIEGGKVDPRRTTRVALALALEKKLRRRVTEYLESWITLPPDRAVVRAAADHQTMADVFDFMLGWREVAIEAEVACGEPLDYSVHGETALIPEGEVPDESKGERLLRARGDSMEEFGIKDGDYVVVEMRKGGVAATGEVVIAWFRDGITMKRWMHVGGRRLLQAGSPEYETYEVASEGDGYELQAIVRRRVRVDYFPKISG